jgi:hypothetical protein
LQASIIPIQLFNFYYEINLFGQTTGFSYVSVNKNNGTIREVKKINLLHGSGYSYVFHFMADNRLFYIASNLETEKLKIKIASGIEEFEEIEFDSVMPRSHWHFVKAKFELVDDKYRRRRLSTSSREKVYYNDGRLIFTFDNYRDMKYQFISITEIVTINLNSHISEYKSFMRDSRVDYEDNNTYLLDSILFRFSIAPNFMDLSIIDFNNLELLNNFTYLKDSVFPLNTDSLIVIKSAIGGERMKIPIKKDAKLIRKLNRGIPSVKANRLNDTSTVIFLGYYFHQKGTVGGGAGGAPSTYIDNLEVAFYNKVLTSLEFNVSEAFYEYYSEEEILIKELYDRDEKIGDIDFFQHPTGWYVAFVEKDSKSIKIEKLK